MKLGLGLAAIVALVIIVALFGHWVVLVLVGGGGFLLGKGAEKTKALKR